MALEYSPKEFELMKEQAIAKAREMQKKAVHNRRTPFEFRFPNPERQSFNKMPPNYTVSNPKEQKSFLHPQYEQSHKNIKQQPFPKDRRIIAQPQLQQKSQPQKSNARNAYSQRPKMPPDNYPEPQAIFGRQKQPFNPLTGIFNSLGIKDFNDDKLLIMGLIMLLSSEKNTDTTIILALLYILI
ncbi:MAG TPA: hypothetical protein VFD52_01115 [Clostridia bacterium]|nr:hypothetical protein [Clostridia bacterium]